MTLFYRAADALYRGELAAAEHPEELRRQLMEQIHEKYATRRRRHHRPQEDAADTGKHAGAAIPEDGALGEAGAGAGEAVAEAFPDPAIIRARLV